MLCILYENIAAWLLVLMLCSLSCTAVLNVVLNFTAPHSHQERFFAFLSVPHLWTANSTITWHYWSSPFGTWINKSKRKENKMTQPLDHSQWDRSQKVMGPNVWWDSVLTRGHSQGVGHSRSPDWKPFSAQFNLAFNLMIGHDLGQHRTQPHLGDLPHPTSPWWPPSRLSPRMVHFSWHCDEPHPM